MTDQGFRSMDDDFSYRTAPKETPTPPDTTKLSEADKLVMRVEEIARQNYSLARGECRGHIPEWLAQHWEELPAAQRELFVNLGLSCVGLKV